jgi:hypothetical protein
VNSKIKNLKKSIKIETQLPISQDFKCKTTTPTSKTLFFNENQVRLIRFTIRISIRIILVK